ncbi:unnamed protein product [Effrenium voratum]|nr:unnamed protein product [Effrenium voratum]
MSLEAPFLPSHWSRVPFTFHFEDYNCSELSQIGRLSVQKHGLVLPGEAQQGFQEAIRLGSACCETLEDCVPDRTRGNGRAVRNVVEASVRAMARRLQGKSSMTVDDYPEEWDVFSTFSAADFSAVISESIDSRLSMPCSNRGELSKIINALDSRPSGVYVDLPANLEVFYSQLKQLSLETQKAGQLRNLDSSSANLVKQCLGKIEDVVSLVVERMQSYCSESGFLDKFAKQIKSGADRSAVDRASAVLKATAKDVQIFQEMLVSLEGDNPSRSFTSVVEDPGEQLFEHWQEGRNDKDSPRMSSDRCRAMVEEHRAVCWRDVLKLMYTPGLPEGKKLILRPRLFELVAGPEQILSEVKNEEVLDVLDAFPGDRAGALTLRLSGMLVRVPASAQAFHLEPEAVREAVEGLISTSEEQILACLAPLRKLSLGALKSCLQKVIRFHAKDVSLGQNSVPVPAPVVAAASCGLLFAAKGGFSPELQLFTRGCTAALKRLAVILVEDAWVEDPQAPAQLASLLALGLVTQQMSYEPPRHVVVSAMRLAAKAASSGSVIAWRTPSKSASASKVKVKVSEPQSRFFQSSARLLRVLRSFPGDMEMLDRAAKAATLGALELQRAAERPEVMPLCHLVDQHAFRGVGHVLGAGSGATFAERFRVLFEKCTGCNPRLSSLADFETRPEVRVARFAQRCCLHMALSKARSAIPSASEGVSVSLELDAGVLAAAVGPVPVQAGRKRKRELLVLLGLRCPEDEVVMQKPARATRDLFGELTEQERAEAISVARSQRQKAQSPLLPGTQHAQFRDTWMLDGRKWEDLVKEGLKVTVPSAPAPGWCNESTDWERLLEDDAAFEEALQSAGAGMTPDARKWTLRLTSALPHAVCLRGVSLLRQQYTSIQLPTPSLQGGLVSDQLAAYDGDWLVYRLLVLVSQLVPALRPTAPPNFQVGNPVLLRVLEKWMMEGIQLVGTARPSGPSCSSASGAEWAELRRHLEASAKLMEHQREAICRMVERDEHLKCGGHFLIMDTGHGKTITALLYAFRWLESSGQNVRRIMWVTPAGTVENLVKQLRTTWRCPTHVVPRISSAKKPKTGEGADLALKDFMVNVIHADHLRTAIDKGLAAEAREPGSRGLDEMYAPTLRTSAARRLCQLCGGPSGGI